MSPIIEGLKQAGRVALIAVIPLVIAGLQAGSVDWKAVAIAAGIAFLAGIDKWLHKAETGIGGNGLTGF
jgi:hypothetical protein